MQAKLEVAGPYVHPRQSNGEGLSFPIMLRQHRARWVSVGGPYSVRGAPMEVKG